MKMLALEREGPNANPDGFQMYLESEAIRLWELYQAGIVRELYFRQDRTDAVLILECESTAQAYQVLASLPLVKQGLIEFEVIPLRAYPGFARLFNKNQE